MTEKNAKKATKKGREPKVPRYFRRLRTGVVYALARETRTLYILRDEYMSSEIRVDKDTLREKSKTAWSFRPPPTFEEMDDTAGNLAVQRQRLRVVSDDIVAKLHSLATYIERYCYKTPTEAMIHRHELRTLLDEMRSRVDTLDRNFRERMRVENE